jgi:branched chain amino acid efflux pump
VSGTAALIAGCAAVTIAIKAAGPVALGGRELPVVFRSVIMLLAPALFAGLVVTQALADGKHLTVGPETAGVVAGCVVVAAVVTALLRAL